LPTALCHYSCDGQTQVFLELLHYTFGLLAEYAVWLQAGAVETEQSVLQQFHVCFGVILAVFERPREVYFLRRGEEIVTFGPSAM